jgi:HSP20 family molecular chaperone IbpA
MVYPVDVYNILENDKPVATVIEIACAGMSKDKISVNVNGNKLYVEIGYEFKSEENEETTSDVTEQREYIQKTIAGRSAKMSWALRNNIDKANIKVSYTDGILKISLPLIQLKDEQISFEIE